MNSLFENYEMFIRDHSDQISTPQQAMRMIADNGMFRAYMDALTEGLDAQKRAVVLAVANRQREMILEESANVPASSFGYGWTVLSFPILTDIYAEPIVAELCNVYPVSAPIVSIPRVRIKAKTRAYVGGGVTEYIIPTAQALVRPGFETLNVPPGTNTNVFTVLGVSPDQLKMNRRYTMITGLRITERDNNVPPNEFVRDINVVIRPDNRNQFVGVFTFKDSADSTVTGTLNGHINYDTGVFTFSVVLSNGTVGFTYTVDYAVLKVRFLPYHTMAGRTTVEISTEMVDVTIDPNEDFLVELTQEQVQDYKSIFKVDLAATLSEAIKRQILLNKDYDLAYFLSAAEPEIATYGAALTIDLSDFVGSGGSGDFSPNHVIHVLKNVVPRISLLMGIVRRNFNMYPTYLVSGMKTAALLRSLQDMMVNMPTIRGELGWSGSSAQFMRLQVLECSAVDDSKIYLSTKAPNGQLEKSSIIDLVYNPLYIVQEITDGNTRNFVRSRTMIEVARTDGLGVLTVKGMNRFVGELPATP